jgi:uncharacterized SAM-binding protein YcdF (DUF218 family)
MFECLANHSYNTKDEAKMCCAGLRKAGVRSVIIVTTAFHTRRAFSIYRRICPDLVAGVVSSESRSFTNHEWFRAREGRKAVLSEYTKLLTAPFGI